METERIFSNRLGSLEIPEKAETDCLLTAYWSGKLAPTIKTSYRGLARNKKNAIIVEKEIRLPIYIQVKTMPEGAVKIFWCKHNKVLHQEEAEALLGKKLAFKMYKISAVALHLANRELLERNMSIERANILFALNDAKELVMTHDIFSSSSARYIVNGKSFHELLSEGAGKKEEIYRMLCERITEIVI